jgi:hypothetical protein
MALHLAEISQAVAQGAHAVLLMDQAGWHSSAKLEVPDNITIVLFPPRSPELELVTGTSGHVDWFAIGI